MIDMCSKLGFSLCLSDGHLVKVLRAARAHLWALARTTAIGLVTVSLFESCRARSEQFVLRRGAVHDAQILQPGQ